MKITKKFRQRVIETAKSLKEILKPIYGSTWWKQGLEAAWKITKMFFGMKVSFVFNKVDKKTGEVTERPATGVAMGSIKTIKDGYVKFLEQVGDRTQWRSFKIENLLFA